MIETTYQCSECGVETNTLEDFPHLETCSLYLGVSPDDFKGIWNMPMDTYEGVTSIGSHCKELLQALIQEDEGFSGKHPFGNSGWFTFFEIAFVKHGIVAGKLTEDGLNLYLSEDEYDINDLKGQAQRKRITKQTKSILIEIIKNIEMRG